MNKLFLLSAFMIALSWGFQSCDDGKTYAEQKEEEEEAIQKYITEKDIKVISEDEFLKDTITNVEENEYVFLEKTGVYMQIVHNDENGKVLGEGRHDISTKFVEIFIKDVDLGESAKINAGDTIAINLYSPLTECMIVQADGKGSFSGKFTTDDKTSFVMYSKYKSLAVPTGWLIPLSYLKLKKYISAQPSEKYVRVKLIVPHSEGTENAKRYVYPCYYEITYFLH